MSIEEAKQLKKELENRITELLVTFSAATNLSVSDITVYYITEDFGIGSKHIIRLTTEVKL